MDASDVMTFVKNALQEEFQNPVYLDGLPENVTRPCFALELKKAELTDLNLALVSWTAVVQITGYETAEGGQQARNLRQDRILKLFSGGRLAVDGRFPTVTAGKGKGGQDSFQVRLTFTWSDARPDDWQPQETVPKMEQYELTTPFPGGKAAGDNKI